MSYTYADRKKADANAPQRKTAPAQPGLDALRSGAAKPTAEQTGHRVDLPEAMRAKMEESFGADLSAVKLYESEAVGAAGAEAVAQGSHIAFAPGMLDFSSFGGQALLGHELSHVVSQSRGEVAGGGFLNDHALEARADREGAMAAAGQQIAAPTAAISSVSAAPAAGPMQAKKKKTENSAVKATNANIGKFDSTSYLTDDVRSATGASGNSAARQAYMSMAETDYKDATDAQRDAFNSYVADQADINNYLRAGGKPKGMSNATKATVSGQIKQMDKMFAQRSGLAEDMTVFRGANDGFLQYLLQQGGFDSGRFMGDDGKIDHAKLRSSGIIDEINKNGLDYQDKAYVSTSTSRGFANYFPVMDQVKKNETQMRKDIHDYKVKKEDKKGLASAANLEERQAIWDAAMHNAQYESGIHMMNMHLSDDVKGVAVDKMGDTGQNEFLLDRGQNYRVTSIHEVGPGRYEMDVEVMTPKGKKRVKKQVKQPK